MFVTILPLLLSAVNCTAQEYINPQTEIYSYRFRFSKLQPGTFGNTVTDTLYIGKTVMSFSWIQSGLLRKYDEQAEPVAFSKSLQVDSLIFDITASEVTFWDDTTAQYLTRRDLSAGEWQCQIAASRWDSTNNVPVWSKFSDAVAFWAVKETIPFDAPVYFKIKFQ